MESISIDRGIEDGKMEYAHVHGTGLNMAR
jgi:hypothetical protein